MISMNVWINERIRLQVCIFEDAFSEHILIRNIVGLMRVDEKERGEET